MKLLLFLFIFLIPFTSAVTIGFDNGSPLSGNQGVTIPNPPTPIFNNNTGSVNSSDFWDNLDTPADITGTVGNTAIDTPAFWSFEHANGIQIYAGSPQIEMGGVINDGKITYTQATNSFGFDKDVSITPTSGSPYLFTTCGGNCLTIQAQDTASPSHLRLMSNDGDGTDNVLMSIHGVGTPADVVNRERLIMGWDKDSLDYHILTEYAGTGQSRPLHLGTVDYHDAIIIDDNNGNVNFTNDIYPLNVRIKDDFGLWLGTDNDVKIQYRTGQNDLHLRGTRVTYGDATADEINFGFDIGTGLDGYINYTKAEGFKFHSVAGLDTRLNVIGNLTAYKIRSRTLNLTGDNGFDIPLYVSTNIANGMIVKGNSTKAYSVEDIDGNPVFRITTLGQTMTVDPNNVGTYFIVHGTESNQLRVDGKQNLVSIGGNVETGTKAKIWGNTNISGNATYNSYYAEGYGVDIGDVAMASAGVYYNITNFTQGSINGFTFNADGGITPDRSGLYQVTGSYSFSGTANNEYHIRIAKKDVGLPNCHAERVIGTGGDVGNAGLTCFIRLETTDYLNAQIENVDSSGDPTIHNINFNIVRIGN